MIVRPLVFKCAVFPSAVCDMPSKFPAQASPEEPSEGMTEWWQYICTVCTTAVVYPYLQIEPPQTRTCQSCDQIIGKSAEGCMIRGNYMGTNPANLRPCMTPRSYRAAMDGEPKPPRDLHQAQAWANVSATHLSDASAGGHSEMFAGANSEKSANADSERSEGATVLDCSGNASGHVVPQDSVAGKDEEPEGGEAKEAPEQEVPQNDAPGQGGEEMVIHGSVIDVQDLQMPPTPTQYHVPEITATETSPETSITLENSPKKQKVKVS